MIALWLLAASAGVLVAVYMTRPLYKQHLHSAASFFKLDPAKIDRTLLRLGNPLASPPFYLQSLVLALLIAAVWAMWTTTTRAATGPIGLWLLLDTSASMETIQAGEPRAAAAQREALGALGGSASVAGGAGWCVRVSAFDLEARHLPSTRDPIAAVQAVASFAPRALGTDLSLIQGVLLDAREQAGEDCPITHVVVVTDQPRPATGLDPSGPRLVWRDIAMAAANTGINAIRADRSSLTGEVNAVRVEVVAFGGTRPDTHLEVTSAAGDVQRIPVSWGPSGTPVDVEWEAPEPGEYTLRLQPADGVYTHDDTAMIAIPPAGPLRVNWRLPDAELPSQFGWVTGSASPDLRVTGDFGDANIVPTLIVGSGYLPSPAAPGIVGYFQEGHPLLNDLNLDVAESLGISGLSPLDGFQSVLSGADGRLWLAARAAPPAAYVPGLPTGTGDEGDRFATTAFFNAVRWLLSARPLPPLYSLTSPAAPEPEGTRLALFPGEGDTSHAAAPAVAPDWSRPSAAGAREPLWPRLLWLAVLLFLLDRGLTVLRGRRWL